MKGFAELPSVEDVLKDDLARPGQWYVANIASAPYWTVKVQRASFRGLEIFILPQTKEGNHPALAARAQPGQPAQDVRRILSGFLSSLCWTLGGGALIEAWTGGSLPYALAGFSGRLARTLSFELDYLPDPPDEKGRLALALCREAGGLNTASYAVISYFRVFEIHFQGVAREIKDWINSHYMSVASHHARQAVNRLQSEQSDVGAYLYDSCRSAAAHGKIGKAPVINPDDPEDELRLHRDLSLVRDLAIKLTEEILGVQTKSTVFREHLYELAGFKALFGDELVSKLARGERVDEDVQVDLPALNIGLMDQRVFPALCGLHVMALDQRGPDVALHLTDDRQLLQMGFVLRFDQERLEFDPYKGLGWHDDKSAAAASVAADISEFQKWLFLNGRLRIESADTGELIARKEAYMPVNVIVNPRAFDRQIKQWRTEAERRKGTGEGAESAPQ